MLRFASEAGAGLIVEAQNLIGNGSELLLVGSAIGGPADAGFGRLVLANPPAITDGFATGIYAATGLADGSESFTTYNGASDLAGVIGIQPLADDDYTPVVGLLQNPATSATAHALIQSSVSAGGTANTVRSLAFHPGASFSQNPGQSLTVSSGQMLIRSGQRSVITGGILDFGPAPGVIATFGDLILETTVLGSGGYTKSGPGILTLGAQPTGAAEVAIGAGTLRLATPDALANSRRVTLAPGATFDLEGNDVTVGGLAAPAS